MQPPNLLKRLPMGLALFAFPLLLMPAEAQTLRIMSFNVRYPAKTDGPNVWENRRDLLVDTIREFDPDVLGTQELFHEQGEYIVSRLTELRWFGVSRRGNQTDEFMGVFYHARRVKLIESGNFWLSETPDVPGSISWNMSLPRMVTWGLFQKDGRRFYFYNTHFAHRREDDEARRKSAELLAQRIRALPAGVPVIVTGDFNTGVGTPPYETLTRDLLRDARRESAKVDGPEGTFNGFQGISTGPRIDWILARGPVRALEAATITRNDNGRYPSDHFPVSALFEFRRARSR